MTWLGLVNPLKVVEQTVVYAAAVMIVSKTIAY